MTAGIVILMRSRSRNRSLPPEGPVPVRHHVRPLAPGILPCTLRASLQPFKIAPGTLVEPLDFLAELAAPVPTPTVNLTRFHGIFARYNRYRASVTRAKHGKGSKPQATGGAATSAERHAATHWAQHPKRVSHIDVEIRPACGGAVKAIACIEDPVVIKRNLDPLDQQAGPPTTSVLPEPRAPPMSHRETSRPRHTPSGTTASIALRIARKP